MNHLTIAFKKVGGPQAVANACDISVRAVYKWLDKGKLPRTEYSGETFYAEKICALPDADFTSKDLLHPEEKEQDSLEAA